ncbi:MAG: phosphatidate cytidylyltransferase [Paludibacteraceae bacterium]|nr:phosphatidate cytidylyltransferase [Paludibacteraceae bacterium]
MSEFWKRTLSGAIFVACVIGSILWHPAAFCALLLIIMCWGVWEFHTMVGSDSTTRWGSLIATLLLWTGTQWFVFVPENTLSHQSWGIYAFIAAAYILVIIGILMEELWHKEVNPIHNWGNLFISQAMIVFPMSTMGSILYLDKWLLLALFVLIWANDTGAYCVGSLTAKWMPNGNHKMFIRVSPKKSWEGLLGGIIVTILVAYLLGHFGWFDTIAGESHHKAIIFGFAALVCAFGTFGDLMESLMKRTVGVKDSGHFLPGHGGVLDRFDSILFASPILAIYCYICYMFWSLF